MEGTNRNLYEASQTLLLRKQSVRLRKKERTSSRAHINVFDDLVRRLKCAGAKMEDCDLVAQLFLTLLGSYDDPLVTALENLAKKDLKLEIIKQWLVAEESKRADHLGYSGEDIGATFVRGTRRTSRRAQTSLLASATSSEKPGI